MKNPTAIQIAEDLHFSFQSAESACQQNPEQAVYTAESVINILTKYGHPKPDFKGRAIQVTSTDNVQKARMRRIGKAIEQAMKDKGITQAQLAALTGIAAPTINRWTSGNANLELSTIFLIEEHLPLKLLNL